MKVNRTLSDEKAAELEQVHSFEALKHLTTLNSAAILLLTGLLEKLFPNPRWRFLVYCTLCLFALSILASVWGMFFLSSGDEPKPSSSTQKIDEVVSGGAVGVSAFSFFFGMATLVVFVIKNF